MKTQNTERQRIARELHDSTAQHITAISLGLARLREAVGGSDVQDILADMSLSLQEAHSELRSMTYLLHPPEIEGCNIVAALQKFVDGFARRTRLNIRLDSPSQVIVSPNDKQLALYRVVQEALVNASRHAHAKNIVVRLRETRNAVRLEVKDDGVGVPSDALNGGSPAGLGIPGMRARMEEFRGSFGIYRMASGTKVQAVMPIDNSPTARSGDFL